MLAETDIELIPGHVVRGRARCPLLHPPGGKSSFSPCRIIFDPVDRLTGKPCGPGDLANACRFPQHRLSTLKLLAGIARLAPLVGVNVSVSFGVRDVSALRFLGG